MAFPIDTTPGPAGWTEIPSADELAAMLLAEQSPSLGRSINERRARSEDLETLRRVRAL